MNKDINMEKSIALDYNIALLIDAENISADYISYIIDEANKYGTITYRRVYGDWTTDLLKPWKPKCIEYSLTPVQQYAYVTGKNVSDFTLIIDAMDILYKGKIDCFCLVSSDSDFTKLVTRLKEDSMMVIGMGETKTPTSLVNSCEQFIYLDKIRNLAQPKKIKPHDARGVRGNKPKSIISENSITPLEDIVSYLESVISENAESDGWVYWSMANNLLAKKYPGFNPRNYGKNIRPINFLEAHGFTFKKEGTLVYISSTKEKQL
jgi:uncharacterized LabA/DUF88 family protein